MSVPSSFDFASTQHAIGIEIVIVLLLNQCKEKSINALNADNFYYSYLRNYLVELCDMDKPNRMNPPWESSNQISFECIAELKAVLQS